MYYFVVEDNTLVDEKLGKIAIYRSDLQGTKEFIAETKPDIYDYVDAGAVRGQCIQVIDNVAYFTVGKHAGTANIY